MQQQKKEYKTGGSLGTIWTGPANENPGVVKAKADKARSEANLAKYKKKSDNQKSKAIEKAKNPNTKVIVTPKFTMFAQANAARNNAEGEYTDTPAKKRDSMEYRAGFNVGLRNKMSGKKAKMYQESEFEKMGRWEGQNHSFKNKDAETISKKMNK